MQDAAASFKYERTRDAPRKIVGSEDIKRADEPNLSSHLENSRLFDKLLESSVEDYEQASVDNRRVDEPNLGKGPREF